MKFKTLYKKRKNSEFICNVCTCMNENSEAKYNVKMLA